MPLEKITIPLKNANKSKMGQNSISTKIEQKWIECVYELILNVKFKGMEWNNKIPGCVKTNLLDMEGIPTFVYSVDMSLTDKAGSWSFQQDIWFPLDMFLNQKQLSQEDNSNQPENMN